MAQEDPIHPGAAKYRQAARAAVSPRETELAAFNTITQALEDANDSASRIRALGRNHELWSMLVKDLALQSNRLPDELKKNLMSLGLWAMRYSTFALLNDVKLAPLIEVNRNVSAGIAAQQHSATPLPEAIPGRETILNPATV